MVCEDVDLASEVATHTLMELLCDLFTYSHAFDSFDTERGEILKDHQLVKTGRCFIFLMPLLQV